ncbi:MAG: efflux RND transporter permease subunit, partial [bacterium]
VFLLVGALFFWGLSVAPFNWEIPWLIRDTVAVDAIPDIGENQQIVFTEWMGRSPQDVEDQITYPLTVSLLGVPGVKTVRSYSFFGFSSIYIIFKDDVEFYWSRSRVLEKLSSLPAGTLPDGVSPTLGPDATALGQIYWYTLEGRDPQGNPTGGWGLDELRSIQDWYVKYGLMSAEGVSEVASVGGFVQEYQIDVDPDAMRASRVTLDEVFMAVKMSNVDVGARSIEVNKAEYIIRGLGFIKRIADIENSVIKVNDNVPIYIKDVAHVSKGPALRRGALDKEGAEVVGGVVVARYGENPLAAIKNVKQKIQELSLGLPKKTLSDGTVSQVTIVPFYDRTGLIHETIGTLETALTEEIMITIIVVIVMLMHLSSSLLTSAVLPFAVLLCFIAMKFFHVDANIMALSGIAIAIGTMVDMGIILVENMVKHLHEAPPEKSSLEVIYEAASEVGSAILTAISTTIVSFLPVFTMTGAEGKLFKPLAYTKSFALVASVLVALTIMPALGHIILTKKKGQKKRNLNLFIIGAGIYLAMKNFWIAGLVLAGWGLYRLFEHELPESVRKYAPFASNIAATLVVVVVLTRHWLPLGPKPGLFLNIAFVVGLCAGLLGLFRLFEHFYVPTLEWILKNKMLFISLPLAIILFGSTIWLGFDTVFGFLPSGFRKSGLWSAGSHAFPGLGKEFMPPLDEGSYLLMPTTMPHASIGECLDMLQKMDIALSNIPEVESVVGKLGRVESSLDPAPISMFETVINYRPEYITDKNGRRVHFRYDDDKQEFVRDNKGELIPDNDGIPFRQWRDEIKTPDDIWKEIVKVTKIPGTTSAPKLQPIAARIVMLQSGMRAPMGVKVKGPDLKTIEKVGLEIEKYLKQVPSVEPAAVFADRIIGKPYLEIDIDRKAIARYGINVRRVQDVIEIAIGGRKITTTVEGRERYPVRVRYQRELRDRIESLGRILIPAPDGTQIPLIELAQIKYIRGPQVIKSEDTFLIGYVLLDKKPGFAEVEVVENCQRYLQAKIDSGEFKLPAGVSYTFAGSYENQVRSEKKLLIVLPLALFIIFLILYFQFHRVSTTLLVFSGIVLAWAGGFQMIWLYSQDWFLNFSLFGRNMQELFQVHPFNLSVAVWVGFIALFGIASDDGVVIATYLDQTFADEEIKSIEDIRRATIHAGSRRIRPCLMTTATTILALIPVLTSVGRGADVMIPMAIPSFGGMTIELITLFVVPTLYCWIQERKFLRKKKTV